MINLEHRQQVGTLDYGETVPGVTCPICGGELVMTSIGAYCDWDLSYVPVAGGAVVIPEGDDDESEWDDIEDVP